MVRSLVEIACVAFGHFSSTWLAFAAGHLGWTGLGYAVYALGMSPIGSYYYWSRAYATGDVSTAGLVAASAANSLFVSALLYITYRLIRRVRRH